MDSAMYFFNKTKTYCYDKTDIYNQIDCKIFIAKMMGATGDYMEAYKNQRAATSLINSLYRFTNSYEINILQTKLEASRKQVVINTLTDECNLQHQTINDNIIVLEKQKDYIRLGIIFLSLLILLILLIIYHLQQKRKDNKELRNKNIKIAQQKEEIEQQSYHLLEINEELEKLSLVAKETGNGIKIMDESGRVIWINEGYTKMHGYTLSDFETVGNVIDILGEQASIDIHQLLNTWYGDKQPITFESLNKTKSGEDIWIHTVLTPIFGESGRIQKMIAVDTDITIIKKVEQELTLKNENITASISYAQRIQEAMTTPFSVITNYYKNSFKFYKPKSIVSGDFYWASHTNNRLVIACADSTGHGVPGAFMSMIGMSFLNKIVNEKGIVSPDLILNRMRKNLINHLRQDDNEIIAEDGFDMSVISIDIKNYKLEYAGAMNPIYIIRGDEFIELKADRMPVAYFDNVERPFTKKEIELKKGDIIYMFTDGYYDQFGGDNGSKMKGNRFRTVLKATSSVSVTEQQNIIDNAFYKWKREYPQIDDVLVMCINVD
jgi:PAS domain S-box-containing protein